MNSIKNIVFLGMMGSGKTTIGKLVSKKLGKEFHDIDYEIEKKTKQTIKAIFEKKGEVFFRKLEEKITLSFLKKNDGLISLGGGAFLNKNIQKEILDNHLSVWLKWEESTLIKRIKNSKKRPVASKLNEDELKKLIKDRSKVYSKAHIKIKCDKLTKKEIIDKIIKFNEKLQIIN